jgi:protein phosphatase
MRAQPPAEPPPVVPDNTLRRRLGWGLAGLALVVLLGLAGWAGWNYVLAQYYVGVTPDSTVAIFRGVSGGVAGIELHRVDRRTDLRLDDLQPAARGQLRSGIPATSLGNARQILDRLHRQQLPPCQHLPTVESSTPTPAGSPQADPAHSRPVASPSQVASPRASPTPSPARTPTPGVDCREPHS